MISMLGGVTDWLSHGMRGFTGSLTMILTSAVVAALVSAVVALIGHRTGRQNALLAGEIARENAKLSAALESSNKLADSRQNWIDQLRDDMSKFMAVSSLRNRAKGTGLPVSDELFGRILEFSARISMRMNPTDEDYAALEEAMVRCMNAGDAEKSGEASRAFVEICQRILKREWNVLKNALLKLDKLSEIG